VRQAMGRSRLWKELGGGAGVGHLGGGLAGGRVWMLEDLVERFFNDG
jgi:hypothetical protein